MHLAFSEGFANYFSGWVRRSRTYTLRAGQSYDLEGGTDDGLVGASSGSRGEFYENAVAGLLWDLQDQSNDASKDTQPGLGAIDSLGARFDLSSAFNKSVISAIFDGLEADRPKNVIELYTTWFGNSAALQDDKGSIRRWFSRVYRRHHMGWVAGEPPRVPLSPADGLLQVPSTVPLQLRWDAVPNATGYRIFFGPPGVPLTEIGTSVTPEFAVPEQSIDPLKPYQWRVVPMDVKGGEAPSYTWKFQTKFEDINGGTAQFPANFTLDGPNRIYGGAVVTALAGTRIAMTPGASLSIEGGARLVGDGTTALPISFVKENDAGAEWGSVTFAGSGSRLANVRFIGGQSVAFREPSMSVQGIRAENTDLFVEADGVAITNGTLVGSPVVAAANNLRFDNLDFTNTNQGLYYRGLGGLVTNSTFSGNQIGLYTFTAPSGAYSTLTASNNTFSNNGSGASLRRIRVWLSRNLIENNTESGLFMSIAGGDINTHSIIENVVSNNGIGVSLSSAGPIELRQNRIENNRGAGIDTRTTQAFLRNNVISYNWGAGVFASGGTPVYMASDRMPLGQFYGRSPGENDVVMNDDQSGVQVKLVDQSTRVYMGDDYDLGLGYNNVYSAAHIPYVSVWTNARIYSGSSVYWTVPAYGNYWGSRYTNQTSLPFNPTSAVAYDGGWAFGSPVSPRFPVPTRTEVGDLVPANGPSSNRIGDSDTQIVTAGSQADLGSGSSSIRSPDPSRLRSRVRAAKARVRLALHDRALAEAYRALYELYLLDPANATGELGGGLSEVFGWSSTDDFLVTRDTARAAPSELVPIASGAGAEALLTARTIRLHEALRRGESVTAERLARGMLSDAPSSRRGELSAALAEALIGQERYADATSVLEEAERAQARSGGEAPYAPLRTLQAAIFLEQGLPVPEALLPPRERSGAYSSGLGASADGAGTEGSDAVPDRFAVMGEGPNPFRSSTKVVLALKEAADVTADVYDVTGRRVARLFEGRHEAGRLALEVDGARLASGVYVVRTIFGLTNGQRLTFTTPLTLVKH